MQSRPKCRFLQHHGAGSWYSVAEGGDDPYDYYYCMKVGWSGSDEETETGGSVCDDCKFYEPEVDLSSTKGEK